MTSSCSYRGDSNHLPDADRLRNIKTASVANYMQGNSTKSLSEFIILTFNNLQAAYNGNPRENPPIPACGVCDQICILSHSDIAATD
jgi:hypothetical protein